MRGKELLQVIWNLGKAERPALILEETEDAPLQIAGNADDMERCYQIAIHRYNTTLQGRDDNYNSLVTGIGTHIIPCALGGKERVFQDGHKYLENPIIYSVDDVDNIKKPNILDGLLGKQIRLIEYFANKTNGKIPIRVGDIQNPLGLAEMIWETNDFYISLYEHPGKVHQLLELLCETVIEYIDAMKAVCDNLCPLTWPLIWAPKEKGIYIADDTMSMVSPEMYEEFGVKYNNIISREFGGLMLHSCTMNERYFGKIIKNESLRSVNFASQYSADMSSIYDYFGGKAVILPHYQHGDNPQIGTEIEFLEKIKTCWKPEYPTIIYISSNLQGGRQDAVLTAYNRLFGKIEQ